MTAAPQLPSMLTLQFSAAPQAVRAAVAPSTPSVPRAADPPSELPREAEVHKPTEVEAMPSPVPVIPERKPVSDKAAAADPTPQDSAPIPTPAVPEIASATQPLDGATADSAAKIARAQYEQVLAAWLDRHKYYPSSLRRRGLEGEGVLRVELSREGRVLSLEPYEPMPDELLDRVAMDWVKRAEPFPAVPDAIPGERYSIRFPIRFNLD